MSVITDETGKVIAVVINGTRYSPEAIIALQTNTINLADHEAIVNLWKETASHALNALEAERRKRLEAEQRLEQLQRGIRTALDQAEQQVAEAQQTAERYAARIADVEIMITGNRDGW